MHFSDTGTAYIFAQWFGDFFFFLRLIRAYAVSLFISSRGGHVLRIDIFVILWFNRENSPFYKTKVHPLTVASMTAIAMEVRKKTNLPLGINVLRNDGISALSIAHAVNAQFIRVNILSGARVTDQGIIEGISAELSRFKSSLRNCSVEIWADVDVKHSSPLGANYDLVQETHDILN